MMTNDSEVPQSVRQLAAALATTVPMRRGHLHERRMKCSKTDCPCATDDAARHGPYHTLTRSIGGKTKSRYLTEEQAAVVREQIKAGAHFRDRIEEFWQACEQWADAQVEAAQVANTAAKKGASEPTSKRTSRGKSKPS